MKAIKGLILTGLLLITQVHATLITTNEAALDSIFSQTSFGNRPIDIRIGDARELVFPSLLDISTSAEIRTLFDMHFGLANVVNFYFVDTISACGSTISSNIVGCGEYFGNDFVVESSFAAGGYGGELLAHELGHNLGLPHLNGAYLMNPSLNSKTTLTTAEILKIHASPLVQSNGLDFWIDINPVLVVAQATNPEPIPEPSILLLFLLSFALFGASAAKTKSPIIARFRPIPHAI